MRLIRDGLLIAGAAALAAPLYAQNTDTPPPPPPPPPTPQIQRPPGMPPGMAPPRPPSDFRFRAPVGMQARFTYMSINGHKDDLKLTEAQQKQVEDLWQKSQTEAMARNQKMMELRQTMDTLTEADTVDMAKVEPAVRAVQNAEADNIIADIRLNQALLNILTKTQRDQLKTLPPSFGMPGMGMRPPMPRPMPMPGAPGAPGAPGGHGGFGTPPGPPPAP